jgi:hypothetical protein
VKKEDARLAILVEWHSWAAANGKTKPNGMDGLMFFSDVSREKPHLVQFRTRGDPWQDVQGWLLHARLVSD